jgi:hypothetical protein
MKAFLHHALSDALSNHDNARQSISESARKGPGTTFYAEDPDNAFTQDEENLWADYLRKKKAAKEFGLDDLSEDSRKLVEALVLVATGKLKTPLNVL